MKRKNGGSAESSRRFPRAELFLAFAVLAVSSCASMKPASEWLRPEGRSRPVLRTLRAEARVEVRRQERRVRFHASILAAAPDRLYVQTSGFGFVSAAAAVKGDETLIYLPSRAEAYRGDEKTGLPALMGVRISAREWIGLLLGSPDLPAGASVLLGEPLTTAAGPYPSRIRVSTPGGSADIRFENVTANPYLEDAWFRIDLPENVIPAPLQDAELLKGD